MDAKRIIASKSIMLPRRIFSFILLMLLSSMLFSFVGIAASRSVLADENAESPLVRGSLAVDDQHYLGLQPSLSSADAFAQIIIPQSFVQPLAASADLSGQLPPVGNQGQQGSCVAWATSYYYKTWSESKEHASWNLTNSYYQFSPSFVYNQINRGSDGGSSFTAAFSLLQNSGDVDISQMPYNQNDYRTQPSSATLEAAKPYRIPGNWAYFWTHNTSGPYSSPNNIDTLKTWLSSGKILVMGIPIYYDWPNYGSSPARAYYDYNGTSGFAGGHGVCICGYDDNINPSGADPDHRGGFKMVNSWGPNWNGSSHGYVYLSYDFVKRYVWEAWSMSDLSPDAPSISSLSSSIGNAGDTIHIYGNNFGTYRRSARVSFNGTNAPAASFTNGDITVAVPSGAGTGPLTVYDWEGTASNSAQFIVPDSGGGPYVSASVSGGHGSVVEAYQSVNYGGTATIHINPDAGYHISSIKDNGTITAISNPYVMNNVSAAHEVVVSFAIDTFTVAASASGGHGSVVEDSQTVDYDGTATVHYSPDNGYRLSSISDNGAAVGSSNPYLIYNVRANHDVLFSFVPDSSPQAKSSFYFAEGCTRRGFDEWLCMLNSGTSPTTAHITYIFTDGTTMSQDVPIDAMARTTLKVNEVVGPDKDVSIKITSDGDIVAERPMYFNYNGIWSGGHDIIGAPAPLTAFYFAEGCTRPGFDQWLCLMNPGDSPTTAHITYMFANGGTQHQDVQIGPTTRSTIKVNNVVGRDRDVSVKITSDAPIVAERPIYFNYMGRWTGGHDVIGAASPEYSFYFAEGCTKAGFDEWLCLMNPGDSPTTAHITYMFANGSIQEQAVPVGANSRATVNVNATVGPDRDLSVQITSDYPIVAERPMYFNYEGIWTGGHDVIGACYPAQLFYFAEGYTGRDFDEWLCLMNPADNATSIRITYIFGDGSTQEQQISIGAYSRATLSVNRAVGGNKAVSIKVEADSPIMVERPMYFNYGGKWTGGHDVVGYTP